MAPPGVPPCCAPSVTAMSYYDYHNEEQPLAHPLAADQYDDSDQPPELIVCDGGPNCIYNQHYQPAHAPLEENHRMQHYQPDLDGLIVVGTHISLPNMIH